MRTGLAGVYAQSKRPGWEKRISDKNLSLFVRGEKYDKYLLEATISDVVSLVIRRHFLPRNPHLDIREVFSLGYCKAFIKLKEPWINPDIDLVIIVYSTARNEIGNFLRKLRREKLTPDEDFDYLMDDDEQGDDGHAARSALTVGYETISERFNKMGITTCGIQSFLPDESEMISHGRHDSELDTGHCSRHERKTGVDWFSIKSAVIRTISCGDN
jgi:hypothetical protein